MDPLVWGPPFWFIIHTIAFNYPTAPSSLDKHNHYMFFTNMQFIIPCEICRTHYTAHLRANPIAPFLESKYSLLQWTIRMHNNVNQQSGKPAMETQDVIRLYKQIYGRGSFCPAGASPQTPATTKTDQARRPTRTATVVAIVVGLGLLVAAGGVAVKYNADRNKAPTEG